MTEKIRFPRAEFKADLTTLNDALHEYFCTFEVLRDFGFASDYIYISLVDLDDGTTGVRATLRVPEKRDFNIDVGVVKETLEEIQRIWPAAVEKHNSGRGSVKEASFFRSWAVRNGVQIAAALAIAGIHAPSTEV